MDKMQAIDIAKKVDGKTFVSGDFLYRFISGNTLIVNHNLSSSFRYQFTQEGDVIYLLHGNAFGTEDLEIVPIKEEPFEFSLTFKFSRKVLGIWKEK